MTSRERLPEREAAQILRQVVETTREVLAAGVLHRDIKDENVLLERDTGTARLIDFGTGTLLKSAAYRSFSGKCSLLLFFSRAPHTGGSAVMVLFYCSFVLWHRDPAQEHIISVVQR